MKNLEVVRKAFLKKLAAEGDTQTAIDTGIGAVAGGVGGTIGGGKLAELAYRKAWDKLALRGLRDAGAYAKEGLKRGVFGAANLVDKLGMKAADLGVGAQMAGRKNLAKLYGKISDKLLNAGEGVRGIVGYNGPKLADALKHNELSARGAAGQRAKIFNQKGAPKGLKLGGKIGGGILGSLLGASVGYGLGKGRVALANALDK